MEMTSVRDIDPDAATATVTMDAEDFIAAFSRADPDEDLFFDFFGPTWPDKPISERLSILSRMAALMEQPRSLNLEAGEPEPKE